MGHNAFNIFNNDKEKINGNAWLVENPVANVIIVHGMTEYSFRYDGLAKELEKINISSYALDHIGHKLNSDKGLGVWPKDGFEKCVNHINILAKKLEAEDKPLFIIAHSMGSFMAQYYIEHYDTSKISGVILVGTSGPQFIFKLAPLMANFVGLFKKGEKPSKFLNTMAFASYNKKFKPKKTGFEWISKSEENLKKYIEDEYCGFVPSVNFFKSFFKNLSNLHSKKIIQSIRKDLPILILGGSMDPVGGYSKAIKKLQTLYGSNEISSTLILYPDLRHEILNEDSKDEIYRDIKGFLNKYVNI